MAVPCHDPFPDVGKADPCTPSSLSQRAIRVRASCVGLLLAGEWALLAVTLPKGHGVGPAFEQGLLFIFLFAVFGGIRARAVLRAADCDLQATPLHWGFLALHVVGMLGFAAMSLVPALPGHPSILFTLLWVAVGVLATLSAAFTAIPPRLVFLFTRSTGNAWIYALVGAVGGRWLAKASLFWGDSILKPATDLTFGTVEGILRAFHALHLIRAEIIADRARMIVGSQTFSVEILPWCSGIEGTALMLAFSIGWLAMFRRELRFPQAYLLVPASLVTIWFSNALRIVALILIGMAGAPNVATNGFHSQAGWIAFNCVALGFVVVAGRFPYFTGQSVRQASPAPSMENPTAAYLAPLLAILAAGTIAKAMSGDFDWIYPLRVIAAAAALWYFRKSYRGLGWRMSWAGPVAGLVVFAMWVGLDLSRRGAVDDSLGAGLATVSPWFRATWLALRVAGAVITVPIAEELAFRGFLIRRFLSPDFESRGLKEYTLLALVLSSLLFGLMHGNRWPEGTLAGLVYAGSMLRRGRLGDAVAAHATTNALLAAWVLSHGAWHLW